MLGTKRMDEKREELAAVQHAIWSDWMKYLFDVSDVLPDKSVNISSENATRWTRQMHTNYADLTDREKESDRKEADKVLAVLEDFRNQEEPGDE